MDFKFLKRRPILNPQLEAEKVVSESRGGLGSGSGGGSGGPNIVR